VEDLLSTKSIFDTNGIALEESTSKITIGKKEQQEKERKSFKRKKLLSIV